jgi:DNA mismatch repair protein MutS2
MQASTLRALEFDRIREILAGHALTPLGRARALTLEPAVEIADVGARLALTADGVAYAGAGGSLGLWAPDDLDATLEILGVEGQILDPLQLVGLARFVDSVDSVVGSVRRAGSADDREQVARPYPGLLALVLASKPFKAEVAAVRKAIDASGDVNDDASPALREIRDRLRRQRAKLRSTLENLSKGRDTAKYLQDQIVTDRNGRYVLVVRSEHRESIPGIVHGSSASGASLYLEPLATVELNNETVTLAEKERAEVHRILLALTDAFRRRAWSSDGQSDGDLDSMDGSDLAAMLRIAADLDELYAMVEFARRLDGVAPALAADGRLEWRGARHPLLVAGAQNVAVASDLMIQPPNKALVISGPNTGGKTVALKAFGLLAVMAQSGLLIPVERGSTFTPLRSIFADIGDDQSISASLSTFSARIAHIVEMERALELPSLVLLDEVGSGTDPVEGGALGTAVIDHFLRRGAMIVATTHDDALKSYAATTAGVAAAAFGFVAETYAPTYRLVYGAPGRSLAMEIAERLGMPAAVIADARARRSGRESQLAAHLDRVDKELAVLDQEKLKTQKEREGLAAERKALVDRESRLAEREAVLKRRMDDKLNERLREARAEVDKVVADLKAKAQHAAGQAETRLKDGRGLTTGDIGQLRADARGSLGQIEAAIGSTMDSAPAIDPRDEAPATVPASGTVVYVVSFGTDGIVRSGQGKNVDVEIRGKRMRVSLKDIRTRRPPSIASADAARPKAKNPINPGSTSGGSTALSPVSMELMVIGNTVDEAVDKAEKFLDNAMLADARTLRVVHGHGTGKLRDAIREFFRKHPLVAEVSQAPDNQGGAGATIVTLKD